MKKFTTKVPMWRAYLASIGLLIVSVVFALTLRADAANYSQINSQLQIGDRGAEVSNLQMFLASNSNFYPEGLVTGYFGPLTKEAVSAFQVQYGIDPVGRVGPVTLAKMNAIIAGGGWSSKAADASGPMFLTVNKSISSNSATFSWTTNENATAKVFYNTSPITMNEGDITSAGFGSTNGMVATNDNIARTSQQVTVSGLQPNTTYRYVIVATDESGNVSVYDPNGTFMTSH